MPSFFSIFCNLLFYRILEITRSYVDKIPPSADVCLVTDRDTEQHNSESETDIKKS